MKLSERIRLKRPEVILVIAAIILAIVVATLLIVNFSNLRYKHNIDEIEVLSQSGNSVTSTNYVVHVKNSFEWDDTKAKEREKMAKYAVERANEMAKEDGIRNWNVMGITVSGENRTPIFSYVKDGSITLYVDGDIEKEVKTK